MLYRPRNTRKMLNSLICQQTFAEKASAHPVELVLAVVIWLPIVVWAVVLIHWMVMGDIGVEVGIGAICVALALGYFTVNPPHPSFGIISGIALIVTGIFAPIARSSANKRLNRQLDLDRLSKAYEAYGNNPANLGPLFSLAVILTEFGWTGHAIPLAEDAVSRMPKRMISSENLQIRNWKMRPDSNQVQPVRCPSCRSNHSPGAAYCRMCGSRIYLVSLQRGNLGRDLNPIFAAWLLLVIVAVGIPVVAMGFSRAIALPIIVCMVCLGIFVGIRTFAKVLHTER